MNPIYRNPATAARGTRRAFLLQAACGLLAAMIAAPAPARAQGTLIQFGVLTGSIWPQYQVRDAGTGLQQLPFPEDRQLGARISATTRSDYPGGRQYLYSRYDGQ